MLIDVEIGSHMSPGFQESMCLNGDVSLDLGNSLAALNLLQSFKKYITVWKSYHYQGNCNSDQR